MANREYAREGILELERLVKANCSNEVILNNIKKELSFRKSRKRNRELCNSIDEYLTLISDDSLEVKFPACWLSEDAFEESLMMCDFSSTNSVLFVVPTGCKIMVNSAIRFLSFINLLSNSGVKITLKFCDGFKGTMGYLHRMLFFENLRENIEVIPSIVRKIGANTHLKNEKLVEIYSLNSELQMDGDLPDKLARRLLKNSIDSNGDDKLSKEFQNKLKTVLKTLFSELIQNVNIHSKSFLPAFVGCQIYRADADLIAHLSVSDSGIGLLETLRPKLKQNYPKNPEYLTFEDNELVLEIFRNGISSKNAEAGCGLVSCARQAMKFNASVRVRIRDNLIKLTATENGYEIDLSYNQNQLTIIQGTTITFEFPLKNLTN